MSPEQVEARETDARTDIFALGMVLYEMLTGKKAFDGRSHVSLMAAILERDPAPISAIRPISPFLERVVDTCLAKDPDDRWQTAREVIRELKRALDEKPRPILTADTGSRTSGPVAWIVAVVAFAAFLGAMVPALRHLREPAPDAFVRRFTFEIPPVSNLFQAVAVSPDGRRVVYRAVGSEGRPVLWLRSLDSLTAQPLRATEASGTTMSWSPDNRFLFFFQGNAQLRRTDLLGGMPQAVAEAPDPNGVTSNEDGTIVFSRNNRLYRLASSSGSPEPLMDLDASRLETGHRHPFFLPDNEHFLFTAWSADPARRAIHVGSITTGQRVHLVDAASMAVYSPPRYILYQRDGTLLAQSFDLRRLALTGPPVRIAEDISYSATSGQSSFSVSRTGTLVYMNATSGGQVRQLIWYDRAGKAAGTVGKPDFYEQARLSPDGRRVAYTRRSSAGDVDIWLLELSSGIASRFTSGPTDETDPVWSPDSQTIAYNSPRDSGRRIYLKRVGDSGEEPLLSSQELQVSEDWSADSATFVFRVSNDATRVFGVSMMGERTATLVFESGSAKDEFQLSPDGKWIAFNSDESGTVETYVAAFPSFRDKRQVSDGGGGQPRWRKDGQELFYRTFDGKLMSVPRRSGGCATDARTEVALSNQDVHNPRV